MATIANLKVLLSARTQGFVKGMGRGARSITRFGRAIGPVISKLTRLGGKITALAGLGSLAGIGFLGARRAQAIDSLGKVADKLGATTEGLASLRHVAKLSGLDAATLDMALQRLVKKVGQASAGVDLAGKTAKQMRQMFKAIGLDVDRLANLDADQIFIEWADALSKLPNQAQRVALAFRAVDSSGVAVVNMLKMMGDRWDSTVALTESLGIRLTRFQVALVENMNDAFTNLQTKLTSVIDQILVRLAPGLNVFFSALTDSLGGPADIAEKIVGWIDTIGSTALKVVSFLVPTVLRVGSIIFFVVRDILDGVRALMDAFTNIKTTGPKSISRVISLLGVKAVEMRNLADDFEKDGQSFFDVVSSAWTKGIDAMNAAAAAAIQRGARIMEQAEEAAAAIKEVIIGTAARGAIGSVARGAFGRPGAPGSQPEFRLLRSAAVALKVQNQQLEELRQIKAAIKSAKKSGGLGF